ncbi:outer membrane protein assembly factor BamE [Ideonella sp. 4Y11]|uniref:Outer membrane protein assembly factor BamE n=1 Tax=Ideonella aquatica TaxID=2824119 RepID=A0A941BQH1_9BURK|nr:outer membrane protein assembly factor BamE [Ideonella aquatica]MBQ0959100.1 outer membrane protein assembly factor BamE [Ideonella aquatica]
MPIPNLPRAAARRLPALALTLAVTLASSGCAVVDQSMHAMAGLLTPYRADILQGNVVTREQSQNLKPGLSRDQVRQLLGAPLLADPFHADRWDYVFMIRRQGVEPQRRNLVIWFEGERVSKIEGAEMPSEYEFVAAMSKAPPSEGSRKLALTDEERQALPPPAPRAAASSAFAPLGAARSYPPLEPQ